MDYHKTVELLKKIKEAEPKILVVGDVMLDRYVSGNVSRISPEAPVPILDFKEKKDVLGGAGNVVSNLVNLGARVNLATIVGDDSEGRIIKKLISKLKISLNNIHSTTNIKTTTKTRFISNSTQLLRLDNDSIGLNDLDFISLKNSLINIINNSDCIIISDYDKGVCSSHIIKEIIRITIQKEIPLFIDPKGKNWEKYSNATCITPNTKEAELELNKNLNSNLDYEDAAKWITKKYKLKTCLITRGSQGMTYFTGSKVIHQRVGEKEVFDVSGAGDTVIACFVCSLMSGLSTIEALKLSSKVSSEVITHVGTTPFNIEMIISNE
jgi:rfaE bifunctional protein kinase chain/domain